jgi:hypothetical protein
VLVVVEGVLVVERVLVVVEEGLQAAVEEGVLVVVEEGVLVVEEGVTSVGMFYCQSLLAY